ncbi:MAG: DUF2237 family protein, partial [Vulcanococcus sp.]
MTFNASPPNFVNHPATFVPLLRQTRPAETSTDCRPMTSSQSMAASSDAPLNVLGEPLQLCGCEPMTGWYRDGT